MEMLKVRLSGTKKELRWFLKKMQRDCRWQVRNIEMVKYFCNIHTEKNIDWNISFQTVSCIHLMNVDVYDCNSHIHNPTCFHLTLDLFQTDSVV